MIVYIIVIAVLAVLVLLFVAMYNGLVKLNIRADEAWSDITVQLKRRYDLIPNLVNTVQGYAAHEKQVFEDVTKARANAMNAQGQGPAAVAQAENQFQQAIKSMFAVAEAYPQLRASENFQQLQGELTDTEDKIMASRRFYNSMVRDFNTRRKTFPTNIFANMLGFKKDREFFEEPASETAAIQDAPKVNFQQ